MQNSLLTTVLKRKTMLTAKPTKKDAEAHLYNLIGFIRFNITDFDIQDTYNVEKSLAELLHYFDPATAKNAKTDPWQWLSLAVANPKHDNRVNLCYIVSDGETLTASDGHRLHRVSMPVPAGYYSKKGELLFSLDNPENDNQHPGALIQFSRVIPEKANLEDLITDTSKFEHLVNDNGLKLINLDSGKKDVIVNLAYWKDAAIADKFELSLQDKMTSVRLDFTIAGYDAIAVVMPIRL